MMVNTITIVASGQLIEREIENVVLGVGHSEINLDLRPIVRHGFRLAKK